MKIENAEQGWAYFYCLHAEQYPEILSAYKCSNKLKVYAAKVHELVQLDTWDEVTYFDYELEHLFFASRVQKAVGMASVAEDDIVKQKEGLRLTSLQDLKVISEEEFYANDSITDTARNEFVLFQEDGIYMQIVSKGEGKTMIEMAKEQSTDSTISKGILCKFMEYDIKNDYVCASNVNLTSIVDKMTCKYTHRSRSYTASFTEGQMMSTYGSTVPTGWLKPLDYIRLTRAEGRKARIRLIIPHSSGTLTASGSVLPMYYEISYQLGI